MKPIFLALAALPSAAALASPAAQAVVETLRTPPGLPAEYVGGAVAMDGNRLAVTQVGLFGTEGRVDLYDLGPDGWVVVDSVFGSSPAVAGGDYGSAVALQGDTLIVGNFQVNSPQNVGAVDVFTLHGGVWTPVQSFFDGIPGDDHFGISVALDGDTFVAGARLDGTVGFRGGAAYVYERSGGVWTLAAQLTPQSALYSGSFFGDTVDVEGDRIAVGGFGAFGRPIAALYERTPSGGWPLLALLVPPGGTPGEYGRSVVLDGGFVYVGSPSFSLPGGIRGAIEVFDAATGAYVQRITMPALPNVFGLGHRLAVDGDLMLAGGRDPWNGSGDGFVATFHRGPSGWERIGLFNSGGAGAGTSLALEGGLGAMGALRGSTGMSDTYAMVVAAPPTIDCVDPLSPPIEADGVLSRTWRSATLRSTGAAPGTIGVLVAGAASPPVTTAFGPLCIGSTPARLGVSVADASGTLFAAPNGRGGPLALFAPGTSVAFQFVRRAPGGAVASAAAAFVMTP
ncbi:MAG: FG-GAP repeat protein [Planctomycetota bacterium]